MTPIPDTAGFEVRDLQTDSDFLRRERSISNGVSHAEALARLARVFSETPERVLQELVNVAVDLCGADSAGISLEETGEDANSRFRWIVVAGSFERYLNGTTPRNFSPCGSTLDAGRPQLYRISQPYYDFLGVVANPINDGILIPWVADEMRGTLWAVSHQSGNTFGYQDYQLLSAIADFAAVAVRHQSQMHSLAEQQSALSYAKALNRLAHEINNPLQGLTFSLQLAITEADSRQTPTLERAAGELERVTKMVRVMLSRPTP